MSIKLRLGDRTVEVRAGDSALSALLAAGVPMLYACQEGCCHCCMVRTDAVVPGEAQRGLAADLRAQGAVLACRWKPASDARVWLPGEKRPGAGEATLPPQVAVLVLAGGRSSRMGAPKHDVVLADGRTMLDHVLSSVAGLGLPINLSVSGEVAPSMADHDLPLIVDSSDFEGPLVAVAQALSSLHVKGLLVVGCDQPLLRADVVRRLLPSEGDADSPTFFSLLGRASLAPFPGYFPASCLAAMKRAIAHGERSPRHWIASTKTRWIEVDEAEAATMASFNTPESLLAAGLRPHGEEE